jgi:hypothetical protein
LDSGSSTMRISSHCLSVSYTDALIQVSIKMVLSLRRRHEVRLSVFSTIINSFIAHFHSMLYVICKSFFTHNSNAYSHPLRTGDLADDKFFRKPNDSDCTQFHILCPSISAHGEVSPPPLRKLFVDDIPCSMGGFLDCVPGGGVNRVYVPWDLGLQGWFF